MKSEQLFSLARRIKSRIPFTDRGTNARNWRRFATEVRRGGRNLLSELHRFDDAILISGCQRSGGTILTKVISHASGVADFPAGLDRELNGALILAGEVESYPAPGRHCFQTTYLNERFHEYFTARSRFRLVWLVRHPVSVVHSMVFNWGRYALDELYRSCALPGTGKDGVQLRPRPGHEPPVFERACLAYNGKSSQIFELAERLPSRVFVIDYADLVTRAPAALGSIYRFLDLPFSPASAEPLHTNSLGKVRDMDPGLKGLIESLCMPVYEQARALSAPIG